MLAFIGILIYWFFGVIGAMNIETRLDVEKLLPKNSPLQEANAMISTTGNPSSLFLSLCLPYSFIPRIRSVFGDIE